MKKCGKCKETKELAEFNKNKANKDGFCFYCRSCNSEKHKAWHADDTDKAKTYHLKYLYGITVDEHKQMFEKQNSCCAVCGRHQSEFKKTLSVDHNHETDQVRELLCQACNRAYGLLREDLKTIESLLAYHKKHNKEI